MKKSLIDWLSSLYCPKQYRDEMSELLKLANQGKIRDFTKSDCGVYQDIIIVNTSGHRPRESFAGYELAHADVGTMGEKMGEMAIYNRFLGCHTPKRFKYNAHKYLILTKGN